MKKTVTDVSSKIAELGGRMPIASASWCWTRFATTESAGQFVEWLDTNRYENRGVSTVLLKGEWPVAFRFH